MKSTLPVLALCVLPAFAQPAAPTMDEFVEVSAKVNHFMGTAFVAKDGKVLLDKGYGFADIELNVPNAPGNKFRLGSITKQFTATAIMQLQERGKLSVTDPACKYLDPCPEAWKPVTIHHLLSHTSGIPSYTNMPEFMKPNFIRVPLTPLEIVMLSKDKPLEFQPGEKWNYDNSGYILLGYIIEKVSGEKYANYVQSHIFFPLGMNDSGYDDPRQLIMQRASGYSLGPGGGYLNAYFIDMSLPYAAGSLYSTTADLYRWDRALYTEKVLSRKSWEAMTTLVKSSYGYGLMMAAMAGHKQIGHGGGINGFSTYIARFPDDDAVVIVLSNVESGNATAVARGLAGILFGEKVEMPKERKQISIDPNLLDRYTGTYTNDKITVNITAQNGHLFEQLTGQPRLEIFPYSDHQFFMKVVDATFDFETANGARSPAITLRQNGATISLKRAD